MPWTRFIGRFGSLLVLADGLNSRESHYAGSAPSIRPGICDTALGVHDRAWAMLPHLSSFYSSVCGDFPDQIDDLSICNSVNPD
jgi:hypothetical protein